MNEVMDYRIEKILVALEVAVPKLQDHETRIVHIENNMICDSRKRLNIKKRAEERAKVLSGPKNHAEYKQNFRSFISRLWHDYWQTFGVTTYHDTPAALYDTVLEWIDNWKPRAESQFSKGA